MSEGWSPSLLNLRDFRLQRRPTLKQVEDGAFLPNGCETPTSNKVRRRIIANSPSSSDSSDTEMAKEEKTPLVTIIKSESIMDDDVDIEETNHDGISSSIKIEPGSVKSEFKSEQLKVEAFKSEPRQEHIVLKPEMQVVQSHTEPDSSSSQASQMIGYTSLSRPKKSDAVLEKEKKMRFLREKFPQLESMHVHDILSRHNFNMDKAVSEMERRSNRKNVVQKNEFKEWVVVQDKADAERAREAQSAGYTSMMIEPMRQPVSSSTSTAASSTPAAAQSSDSRKRPGVTNATGIKKRVKRNSDDSESEDDNFDTHAYQDTRVYNSDEDSDSEVNKVITPARRRVLEFFQAAPFSELQQMATCSKKKADVIIESRPYSSWIDLVHKLQANKNLSMDLLNSAQQVILTRDNVQKLMKKCKGLAQEMERAVAGGTEIKHQPKLISAQFKLTNYQMVGVNWLSVMNAHNVNGILADEMGLGKTAQVIAFMAHLKEAKKTIGAPHLIVVPASTLDNWRLELERWCPALNVFVYYGSMEERKAFRIQYFSNGKIADYDVVLTTYTLVSSSPEEKKMFKVTQMHYAVFDEAHMLKNMNTQRYEDLSRIKAKKRILLTGTPLQNNIIELMSLLVFIMPDLFAGRIEDLKSLFQKSGKSKQASEDIPVFEKLQVKQAKDIIKPFILRRLKRDVLRHLPKKYDEMVVVPMVASQREQYEGLINQFKRIGDEMGSETSYNGMAMMTDLRKLSNHPALVRHDFQQEDLEEIAEHLATDPSYKDRKVNYIMDDLTFMSDFEIHTLTKKFKSISTFALSDEQICTSGKFQFFDMKLPELKEGGHRVLIFSQYVIMLNVLEEYLQLRDHKYLRLDGSTPVNVRQSLIDEFNGDPSIFIFILSTRAGGLGINLTAADTVIIHDIDFNPYNDKQAEDRCHRMGQDKEVRVYRLVSQGTIEEGMWQLTQEKLKLEKEITTDDNDTPDTKSVVRLLSSALKIDNARANMLVAPAKKS